MPGALLLEPWSKVSCAVWGLSCLLCALLSGMLYRAPRYLAGLQGQVGEQQQCQDRGAHLPTLSTGGQPTSSVCATRGAAQHRWGCRGVKGGSGVTSVAAPQQSSVACDTPPPFTHTHKDPASSKTRHLSLSPPTPPGVYACAAERYYKVSAEALRVCERLVPVLRGDSSQPVDNSMVGVAQVS